MDELYAVDDELLTAEQVIEKFGLLEDEIDGISEHIFAYALSNEGNWDHVPEAVA
jgi:hypothetical protein